MSLRDEILAAFPDLTPENRDDGVIASVMSVGRTRLKKTECGFGTVLSVLGPEAGAALLDTLDVMRTTNRALFWSWYLLENGFFDFGDPATRVQLDMLAANGVMTVAQADALKAVGIEPVTISPQEVAAALEGYF